LHALAEGYFLILVCINIIQKLFNSLTAKVGILVLVVKSDAAHEVSELVFVEDTVAIMV